ncbi:hypothetical protein CGCA056_v008642 [Colletotrichum aenigma]|uniref:uncharacterized protein n=1 Tax=Colletotrichum aenigma TaxID=1215731 RepID=UPI0018731998|nr:uncharacterized protein CGCA056_v008642 [Colletotrichum aenigma]KAF5520404.1 hypothetical protein CGCA056_v008642 [Colletotrichum aenigma]
MASLSSLGLNLRLADIDENLKSHSSALSWPINGTGGSAPRRTHDFIDDVPCFAYNEVFESGEIFQAVSPGSGIYLPLHSSPCPQPAFTLSKSRPAKTIELDVHSLSLLQSLAIAIPSPFDFASLLANYNTLKSHLQHLESISPNHPTTIELRLLIRDLLLDRALYAGVVVQLHPSQGLLTINQLHDMHQRSVDAGLDDLDSCFSLGLIPDIVTDDYLEGLSARFTETALAGDLASLHELCEPVVRSGEIEWQTSPDLLLKLLDCGRLDIYRYVLDLASRTKDKHDSQQGPCLADITHDALHVAIRLGHSEHVGGLLQQGATFLGVYQGEEAGSGVVLTPLSAAAFWGQADMVRLILSHNIMAGGAQEAAAIALFNDDTEIMQILLSSGVTNPPAELLPEDTVNSFAELSLMDHYAGFTVSKPDAVESAAAFPSGNEALSPYPLVSQSMPTSTERPLQRPMSNLRNEPVQLKGSRRQRHLLGRDLVTSMHELCSKLRGVCNRSTYDELKDLEDEYMDGDGVWYRGISVFRGLMQDSPPSALGEVVDSLLVGNAICLTFFKNDGAIFNQFCNDISKWRSVLPISSLIPFDEVAHEMWEFIPADKPSCDLDLGNLHHFQGLVQGLLALERRREAAPSRSSASGSRLAAIQRAFDTHESRQGVAQGQAIPGRSPPRSVAHSTSSTQQDDFMWADFLHMDRFEEMTRGVSRTPPALPNSWEDALSSTMMLLASVAFSVVLSLVIGLHGSTTRILQTISGTLPGYARSYTLLAEYLAMHNVLVTPKPDPFQSATPSIVPPSPAYGSEAGITPNSSFSSLNTLGMRRNVSSSSISSIASTASRQSSRDHMTRGGRLPCPTPQCTKTFSSVSNRNKHIREGCAFTREKRQPYQCRNFPCTKQLTTKWYRDTHERERCRFRQAE